MIDFLLILFLSVILIKYIKIKNLYEETVDEFNNILKHDIRVMVIAQIRALEMISHLDKNNQSRFIIEQELLESSKFLFEILSVLINTYSNNYKNLKKTYCKLEDLKNFCSNHINSVNYNAKIKYLGNENGQIYCHKNTFIKAVTELIKLALINSNTNSITTKFNNKNNKNIITVYYKGKNLSENILNDKKYYFSNVGDSIRLNFCKKIIDFHNGNLIYKKNKTDNLFKIIIPA
jgi:hypothetical protein